MLNIKLKKYHAKIIKNAETGHKEVELDYEKPIEDVPMEFDDRFDEVNCQFEEKEFEKAMSAVKEWNERKQSIRLSMHELGEEFQILQRYVSSETPLE